jgi:biopolymer transport protein ExbD
MNIKLFLAALLLSLALPAAADFEVVTLAHEIALSNFIAPATQNGGLAFKACAECENVSVRVTSNTQYVVNDKVVKLDKFRQALLQVRNRDEVAVLVVHHLESDTIVSVLVTI